jgi:hypothetical protein
MAVEDVPRIFIVRRGDNKPKHAPSPFRHLLPPVFRDFSNQALAFAVAFAMMF